jgi:flotillin
MVTTAANKFFSRPPIEQMSILTDVLSSAGRRAINLLRHDQLFNARTAETSGALTTPNTEAVNLARRDEDSALAVIIKDNCSRELLDLGISFYSLNIKGVQSEVAEARRRESAARAKASADVVQAQEEQRARIAQLEAQQKINDQERNLQMQVASNGAAIARAEAERQESVREQREAELAATQITQARADAEQSVILQEAEGRAQAARIRLIAEAEADAIRKKAEALAQAGSFYLDLRRLELAPALTREVAAALANGQFVNFGSMGSGGQSAAASGSDDVLRVVQTLMAAQVISNSGHTGNGNSAYARPTGDLPELTELETGRIASSPTVPAMPATTPAASVPMTPPSAPSKSVFKK